MPTVVVSPPPRANFIHHHTLFQSPSRHCKASTFTNLLTTAPPFKSSTLHSDTLHSFSPLRRIQSLCQSGDVVTALRLINNSFVEGASKLELEQKAQAISVLIQCCGKKKDIETGRALHTIVSDEFGNDLVLNTRLISMYSSCGFPLDARSLFENLRKKDLVQWNAVISAYTRNECWTDAMLMFCELVRDEEFHPDKFTLPCVIKACFGVADWQFGEGLHGIGVKMGLVFDVFVGNALVSMYGKMGLVESAVKVFEFTTERNLVSWNSMISAFSDNRYSRDGLIMFQRLMEDDCLIPDVASLVTIFPACAREGEVELGAEIHGLAVKLGLSGDMMLNNAIMDMYLKCGLLDEALILFSNNPDKNVVCWNTMIGGYAKAGDAIAAFDILREMQTEGLNAHVDEVTILNSVSVCTHHSEFSSVKELHCYTIRHSFCSDDKVVNALVTAYSKCGCISYAERVFRGVELKNASSWNAMIAGYSQNGDSAKALDLFHQMGVTSKSDPDRFTIGSILLASSSKKYSLTGREVHGYVLRNGFDGEDFITISLMSFYISCSDCVAARYLFDEMVDKSIVSWNAMLAGYMQNELPLDTIDLFRQMTFGRVHLSEIAMTSVLGACSDLSVLRLGKEAHCAAMKSQLTEDAYVSCSIMDMYAKCGCIRQSESLFDRLKVKDLASWNVLITGYGIHGLGSKAMRVFEEMRRLNVSPDGFTFIGVIMACGHSGLVEQGLQYFNQMEGSRIEPKLEHYACVIDMLSRAGKFDEALELIERMPMDPDVGIWSSLLSMCRTYGRMDLGDKIAKKFIKLQPDKAENYVLASNIYAQSEKWDEVERMRRIMKESGLQKEPGCSWIEVGGKVYNFVAGDEQQLEPDEVRHFDNRQGSAFDSEPSCMSTAYN